MRIFAMRIEIFFEKEYMRAFFRKIIKNALLYMSEI